VNIFFCMCKEAGVYFSNLQEMLAVFGAHFAQNVSMISSYKVLLIEVNICGRKIKSIVLTWTWLNNGCLHEIFVVLYTELLGQELTGDINHFTTCFRCK
jgi:hypothetical protein